MINREELTNLDAIQFEIGTAIANKLGEFGSMQDAYLHGESPDAKVVDDILKEDDWSNFIRYVPLYLTAHADVLGQMIVKNNVRLLAVIDDLNRQIQELQNKQA